MKKVWKLLSLVVSAMMVVAAIAGCSTTAASQAPAATSAAAATAAPTVAPTATPVPTPVPLKQVEMNFYLMGPEPKAMAAVNDALNAMSTKDLSCTVKWTFLGWDNWSQKYQLALTSGEPIDAIYTANWANYATYAANGAYMSLNDLLPKDAPQSWSSLSKVQWDQAKVGGVIYTVPCDWKEYSTDCLTYRLDVAKKLGLGELKTIDDVEKFLDACKTADPSSLPFNGVVDDMSGQDQFFWKGYSPLGANWWMLEDDSNQQLVCFFKTDAFKQYAAYMKRWADKGYWSKDILSAKVKAEDLFKQGKDMICQENPTKANTLYQQIHADHPDWELGVVTYASAMGKAYSTPSCRNGMALPKGSPNPERALMYIDNLRYNKSYYDLTEYGILGTNYTVDGSGNYVASSSDTGFGYQAMQPWGWHVDKMELPTQGNWPGYATTYTDLDKIAAVDKYATFSFDKTNVSGEDAAITQALGQYVNPIYVGEVTDIDAAITEALKQLDAAGLATYMAEVQKQRDAYLADQAKN